MPTVITVDFSEDAKSPQESFDEDGFKAVMTLHCAWTDRIKLARQLAGSAAIAYGGRTLRTDPYIYPYGTGGALPPGSPIPLGTPPVCVGVEVAPLDGVKQSQAADPRFGSYLKAQVTATFRVPNWKLLPNQVFSGDNEYVSETLEPSAEFITLPERKLWWDSARTQPVTDREAPGFIIKMQEWTRTRHRVIRPHSSVFTYMGSVNDATVVSEKFGHTFEAETLLYIAPRIEHVVMPDGTKCHDLVMRFMYRPQGWNRFYREGTTQAGEGGRQWKPVPIYDDTGAVLKLYQPAKFDDLLWR